jgi:hypothetical protein
MIGLSNSFMLSSLVSYPSRSQSWDSSKVFPNVTPVESSVVLCYLVCFDNFLLVQQKHPPVFPAIFLAVKKQMVIIKLYNDRFLIAFVKRIGYWVTQNSMDGVLQNSSLSTIQIYA